MKQAELFIPNGIVNNYESEVAHSKPLSTLRGRVKLNKALAALNNYPITFHSNGQSEISVSGDRAVGETYCIAHQIKQEGDKRKLKVLAIRYYDKFERNAGKWFFEERDLIINISDTVSSLAGPDQTRR